MSDSVFVFVLVFNRDCVLVFGLVLGFETNSVFVLVLGLVLGKERLGTARRRDAPRSATDPQTSIYNPTITSMGARREALGP